MKYASMISRFNATIWCATEQTVKAISSLLYSAANSLPIPQGTKKEIASVEVVNRVGVIQIYGVIGRHLSDMELACGGCDVDMIRAQFDEMVDNPEIYIIALDIDSPGGSVAGVPELAQHIRNSVKPVIAWTGLQMCSAAYYIGAAASYLSMASSAISGCVGVYTAWIDSAKRMDREGDAWVIIKAGTEKACGLDGQMTEKAFAEKQEDCNATYSKFKEFVTKTRIISDEYLQGMAYNGEKSLSIGMVDGLHDTLTDLIKEATSGV